jgi:hypothetical protein
MVQDHEGGEGEQDPDRGDPRDGEALATLGLEGRQSGWGRHGWGR